MGESELPTLIDANAEINTFLPEMTRVGVPILIDCNAERTRVYLSYFTAPAKQLLHRRIPAISLHETFSWYNTTEHNQAYIANTDKENTKMAA